MYNLSRLDPSYVTDVERFIDAAKNQAWRTKKTHIHCPCMDFKNVVVFEDTKQIVSHLVSRGFINGYLIWTKYGEGSSAPYATKTLRTSTPMVQICLTCLSSYMRHNNPTSMFQTPNMLCQMFLIMVLLEETKVSELMWLRMMQNS